MSLCLPPFSSSFCIFFLLQSLALTASQIQFWPSLSLKTQWKKENIRNGDISPVVLLHLSDAWIRCSVYPWNRGRFSHGSLLVLLSFLPSSQISQSGDENVRCHRGGPYQLCVFHCKCHPRRCVKLYIRRKLGCTLSGFLTFIQKPSVPLIKSAVYFIISNFHRKMEPTINCNRM